MGSFLVLALEVNSTKSYQTGLWTQMSFCAE